MTERVDSLDSPDRCQAVATSGEQCMNKKEPESNFCIAHGGHKAGQDKKKESLRNYQLDKFKAKLIRFGSSPDIKSLRDEISILRMVLEERLNQCKDTADLVLQSGPISDMVMKIEKVVSSCHKLEGSMKQLLDKQAILQFANEVIDIIGASIADETILNTVADGIMKAIGRIGEDDESV